MPGGSCPGGSCRRGQLSSVAVVLGGSCPGDCSLRIVDFT